MYYAGSHSENKEFQTTQNKDYEKLNTEKSASLKMQHTKIAAMPSEPTMSPVSEPIKRANLTDVITSIITNRILKIERMIL